MQQVQMLIVLLHLEMETSTANIEYGAIGNAHVFRKDASEYMRIDGNGNVGINEDNPSAQIHNLQKTNDRAGGFYTQLAGNTYGVSMFVNSGGYGIIGSNGAYTTDVLTMDLNSGNVGLGNNNPSVRLEVGSNDSEVEVLSVRYSTVPAYISSSFDGSYALSTFSTNQYNTSDGSASWGSMSNASYGTASVQIAANTQGGQLRFFYCTWS